jgi:hypothetical protein
VTDFEGGFRLVLEAVEDSVEVVFWGGEEFLLCTSVYPSLQDPETCFIHTVIFCLGTKKHLKVLEFGSTSVDILKLDLGLSLCNMYNTKKVSEKLRLQRMN